MIHRTKMDNHYFQSLFEHSPTSIQIYGIDGYLKTYNKAFETLFNVDASAFIGVYNVFEDPQLVKSGIIQLVKYVAEGEIVENLVSLYDATRMNGRERWIRTSMFPIKDENQNVIDFVIMHEDVTDIKNHELYLEKIITERTMELERTNRELEQMSKVDALTSLFNRRAFDAFFENEYQQAVQTGTSLSLILIDIDYFKNYNDCYGHQEGDNCLQKVAYAIKENVHRNADVTARYGGDEFAVILPRTTTDDALIIAERIRKGVEISTIPNVASPLGHITLSLGVKTFDHKVDTTSEIFFSETDQALYRAKNTGKNKSAVCQCVTFTDPSPNSQEAT